MKFLVRERGFLVSKSEFWVEFGLIGIWFEMIAEFGKIIGLGEHCWAWLSSKRIRLARAFSILNFFVFFFFFFTDLFILFFANCDKFVLFELAWIIAGIVTRRPLVLQLHKTDDGSQEYAEFLHIQRRRFTDFGM